MDTHAGAPFCHVCQHYHEQGSKCPICGHSGKANIYKKMRDRSNLCRAYEIEHLNQYSCPDDIVGLKLVCDELRWRLFVNEMGIPATSEFDVNGGHFNYSFGKVGNAPVVLVKWKVIEDGGNKVLIFDNCGVLPEYRCRGLAKRTLNEIIQLCSAVTELHSVVMYTPSVPWIVQKLSAPTLSCRVEKYVVGPDKMDWKEYVCIWNPTQLLGIAMHR